MKYLIFLLFFFLSNFMGAQVSMIQNYRILNEKELRLNEYKDSDFILKLKLKQLALINKSRQKYSVSPVKLDIFASRVANKMAQEACRGKFYGHWNLRGEKPYHRYAFEGGVDHIVENAAAIFQTFDFKEDQLEYLMKNAHLNFMNEKKPYDGHKQTILNKHHNYVGIGVCLYKNQFRYYEEFIDRYFKFKNVPKQVKRGKEFTFKVKTRANYFIHYVGAYYEKEPKKLSAKQVNKKGSYKDYTNKLVKELYPWNLEELRNENVYELRFRFTQKGLYYIHIYEHNKKSKESFDTRGKIQGSGIVIRVK